MPNFDAHSAILSFTTSNSFTHTPSGTPKGALVLIAENVGVTDVISAVTYGGVAMSRVGRATDAAGEPGQVYAYFLGSGLGTGAKTVAITVSSGTTAKRALCITATATGNTVLAGTTGFATTSADQANPSLSITGVGNPAFAVGALFSGLNNPDMSPGTGYTDETAALEVDFGTQTASFIYATAESAGGNVTVNWTSASDDVAAIGVAIMDSVLSVSVTDTTSPAESVTMSPVLRPIVNDTDTATEAVTVREVLRAVVNDADAAAESVRLVQSLRISVNETDAPAEQATVVLGQPVVGSVVVVVNDTPAAAELVAVTVRPLFVTVTDAAGATDAATAALRLKVLATDVVTGVEVVAVRINPITVNVVDAGSPTENVEIEISGGPVRVIVNDVRSSTEAVVVELSVIVLVAVSDNGTATEQVAVLHNATVAVGEPAGGLESVTVGVPLAAVGADATGSDACAVQLPLQIAVSETAAAAEDVQVSPFGDLTVSVSETRVVGERILLGRKTRGPVLARMKNGTVRSTTMSGGIVTPTGKGELP